MLEYQRTYQLEKIFSNKNKFFIHIKKIKKNKSLNTDWLLDESDWEIFKKKFHFNLATLLKKKKQVKAYKKAPRTAVSFFLISDSVI